jgi:hypothetical protein
MQMHDALRRTEGGTVAADLALAFDITPAAAEAALRAVMAELAWHLEGRTLSRAGLADVVEALGSGGRSKHLDTPGTLGSAAVRAAGEALLEQILAWRGRGLALAARVARRSGMDEPAVRAMLPALAVIGMATVESRGRSGLGEIVAVMPSLGRWSKGSPDADLADILRRRCGGGPYAAGRLRRVARRAVAQAAGFPARGALRWYLHFMLLRPAAVLARPIAAGAFPALAGGRASHAMLRQAQHGDGERPSGAGAPRIPTPP